MKKLIITAVIVLFLFTGLGFFFKGTSSQQITPYSCICTGKSYVHDPMQNKKAAKDIQCDLGSIYGYSPAFTSDRLSFFSIVNFSNPVVVEYMRRSREAYHEEFNNMYEILSQMIDEGKTAKEIACAVSAERNRIRLASYEDDPIGLAMVKENNLKTYGSEDGPTPEYLFEKKGSWEAVIVSAFNSNPGMDACVGLYDEYYDPYVALGIVS